MPYKRRRRADRDARIFTPTSVPGRCGAASRCSRGWGRGAAYPPAGSRRRPWSAPMRSGGPPSTRAAATRTRGCGLSCPRAGRPPPGSGRCRRASSAAPGPARTATPLPTSPQCRPAGGGAGPHLGARPVLRPPRAGWLRVGEAAHTPTVDTRGRASSADTPPLLPYLHHSGKLLQKVGPGVHDRGLRAGCDELTSSPTISAR